MTLPLMSLRSSHISICRDIHRLIHGTKFIAFVKPTPNADCDNDMYMEWTMDTLYLSIQKENGIVPTRFDDSHNKLIMSL